MHTYYFKCNYDTPAGRMFTGQDGIKAENKTDAWKEIAAHFAARYPHAIKIYNIRIK